MSRQPAHISPKRKDVALLSGPIAALILYYLTLAAGVDPGIAVTLAITLITAIWWVTEALPIPVTSLLPFVLFPLSGVLSHREAAAALGAHIILLMMGGFMVAKAIEKAGLHRRFAYGMLRLVGGRGGRGLVLAFMLCGAFMSMWISNTATCLVLMPIALAVIHQFDDRRMSVPIVLGIAFSCNLGGIATLVGTPPNLVFAGVYEELSGKEYGFLDWMRVGVPVVVIGLPLMWLWLTRRMVTGEAVQFENVGSWSPAEYRVAAVFGLVVALWVFRLEPFGGWSRLLPQAQVGDSTVAILGVLLMFIIPSGTEDSSQNRERLLDWKTAVDIPWGMLLLFAGGITIARAFDASGTGEWIGQALGQTAGLNPFMLILAICLSVTFMTEITSNVATTTLLMPILAAAASAASLPIELMMIPAVLSSSCAFMLPVATAPNAIVYGTGYVSMTEMAREGLMLNLMMAVVIAAVLYTQLV